MVALNRGRSKRRFSEQTNKNKAKSTSPFAALSQPGKYVKKKRRKAPATPPTTISISAISAMATTTKSSSKRKKKKSSNPFNVISAGFFSNRPKTPPPTGSRRNSREVPHGILDQLDFGSKKKKMKDKGKKKGKDKENTFSRIRSKSPLSLVFQNKQEKSMKSLNLLNIETDPIPSYKNPVEDGESITSLHSLTLEHSPFSDNELTRYEQTDIYDGSSTSKDSMARRKTVGFHRARSLSDDNIKYKIKRSSSVTMSNKQQKEESKRFESKSVVNLDITDGNFHEDMVRRLKGESLNMLPDEDEYSQDEDDIIQQLENDIDKQRSDENNTPKQTPFDTEPEVKELCILS